MVDNLRRRMTPPSLRWGPRMSADCGTLAGSFPTARAKISNSVFYLPNCDRRSSKARRYRSCVRDILAVMDVSEAELSGVERDQVRDLAQNQLQLDDLQAETFVENQLLEKVSLANAIKSLTNTISRQRWQLGIGKRRRQKLTPEDALSYAQGGQR
jgi:hypothetical protein